MVRLLTTALVMMLLAAPAGADQSTQSPPPVIAVAVDGGTQELVLKNGARLIGRVEAVGLERFTFRNSSGVVINVDVSEVLSLRSVDIPWMDEATPRIVELAGPRVGVTFVGRGSRAKLRNNDLSSPVMQFGWQKEKRFYATGTGAVAVSEFVFLVGGFEQNTFLPSLSWLVGFRSANGAEFAVGPNLTPFGAALAFAGGVTVRRGGLNLPLNLAVVPAKGGTRVSLLAGFNARR